MIGLDGDFTEFFITLFLCSFAGGTFGLFFGTITRTTVEAAQTVPAAFLPLLIFSDALFELDTLPNFVYALAYVDPLYYVVRCFYLIEFTGIEYAVEFKEDQQILCRECGILEDQINELESQNAYATAAQLNPLTATP